VNEPYFLQIKPASTEGDETGTSPDNVDETGEPVLERTPSPDEPVFNPVNEASNSESAMNEAESEACSDSSRNPEPKRKRGRPAKKLTDVEPVLNAPEESRQSLTESEPMDVSEEPDAVALPKRIRTKPKRFAPDDGDTPKSGSESAPAKRKRGRPPKSDVSGAGTPTESVTGTPVRDPTGTPLHDDLVEAFKDPLEEDLSESSSDVVVDRWLNPDGVKMNPTPADSSPATSSISSCFDSPVGAGASGQKRSRGRPRGASVGGEKNSATALSTVLQVRRKL
jgi:AT hook motif